MLDKSDRFEHPVNRMKKAWLFFTLGLMACGSSADHICQDQAECLGWGDAQLEQCQSEANAQVDLMEAEGCVEESDEWVDCVSEHTRCEEGEFIIPHACEELKERAEACMTRAG